MHYELAIDLDSWHNFLHGIFEAHVNYWQVSLKWCLLSAKFPYSKPQTEIHIFAMLNEQSKIEITFNEYTH